MAVDAPPVIRPRRQSGVGFLVIIAGLVAVFVILFLFNPSENPFYPRCALYTTTGFLCPGCGGLRAMHQLTHGHFLTALRYNPVAVLSLPFVAGWGLRQVWRRIHGQPVHSITLSTFWLKVLLGVLIAFGILRNLRFPPFTYLAPP